MAFDDEDLFDAPTPPRAAKPSNKIVFQPAGANWSLSRLPEVQTAYQQAFKKTLPLANKGQGSIHNKWGYDHRDSADVHINPSTPEGQQFTEQLKKMNVPFLAFTGAIPGVATGPHVHIGFPSHKTGRKFNVGSQRKKGAIASDDLFDSDTAQAVSDDDLFDAPAKPVSRPAARPGQIASLDDAVRAANQITASLPSQDRGFGGNPMIPVDRQRVAAQAGVDRGRKAEIQRQVESERTPTFGNVLRAGLKAVRHPETLGIPEAYDAARIALGVPGIPTGEVERRFAEEESRKAALAPVREELDAALKNQAKMSGPGRVVERMMVGAAGKLGKEVVGGLRESALGALIPKEVEKYLSQRSELALAQSQEQPLTAEGQAYVAAHPELEKAAQMVGDMGLDIARIVATKKATGQSLGAVLGGETWLQHSDLPLAERARETAHAVAMGKVLDQHLGRAGSAALFGVPTAVEGIAAGKSAKDIALETGVQAGLGAALGGGGKRNAKTETQPNVTAQPEAVEPAEGVPADVFTNQARDARRAETLSPIREELPLSTTEPHHSQNQNRRVRNTEHGKKGEFQKGKKEAPQEATEQVSTRGTPDSALEPEIVRQAREKIAARNPDQGNAAQPSAIPPLEKAPEAGRTELNAAPPPLKLSSRFADPDAPHRKAVQRIKELGEPNPFNDQERVIDGVKFSVKPFDGAVYLDIESTPNVRGKGNASRVLDQILQTAEAEGADVIGVPKAFGGGGLSTEQLKQWYARHGFEPYRGDMIIKRAGSAAKAETGTQPTSPLTEPITRGARPSLQEKTTPPTEAQPAKILPRIPLETAGEGVRQQAPSSPEKKPSTTSAKHADTRKDREEFGFDELPSQATKKDVDLFREAKAKHATDPTEARRIADKVLNNKHNLTDVETVQLDVAVQEIKNKHNQVMNEIGAETDPARITLKSGEAEALLNEFDRLNEAKDRSGSEQARAFRARRHTINQDFDFLTLRNRAKQAKGRELTAQETERYQGLVKERDQAILDRDSALEKLHTKRLQDDLDKSARQRRRAETKKTLDDEAVVIRGNIIAELARLKSSQGQTLSMGGLGNLDPEGVITKQLLKYARNRAKANIGLKAEALIDEVHSFIKDSGVTRRQVAEALSGYGQRALDRRSEAAKRLAEIRSEITGLLKTEDIEAGRRSVRQEGPKRDFTRNQRRLRQLEAQEKEWERKLNERDFEPRTPREPYPYNREVRAAEDRVRIAENKFEREMERERPGHQLRNISGVMKSWWLSSPTTQAMNIGGTASWQAFREAARLPAVIMDATVSGVRQVAGRGPQRSISGPSPSAMLDSVIQAYKVGGREAVEIMKHGATLEDKARHQYQEIDFGVNTGNKAVDTGAKVIELAHNAVFRFMSASDRVFYQGAYKRNLTDRARIQAKNEDAPNIRQRARELEADEQIQADAKHDALVSTFNNSNQLSERVKRFRSQTVTNKLMSRRGAERLNAAQNLALDFVMPFDRTPTNVIMRIVEASPAGYVKNAGQLIAAAMRRSMPVEHQRQFSQTFGNATAGTALMALGWYLADKAKGIITTDDKGNVYLNLKGHKINLRTASPAGNILAIGARLRGVHDGESDTKLNDAAKVILREPLNQPILRSTSTLSEFARDPERSAVKTGARLAPVPFSGALRFAAQTTDPTERKTRKTGLGGLKDQVQQNIPIWRNRLPENTENARATAKATALEAIRRGERVNLDKLVAGDILTQSDKKAIEKNAKVSAEQQRFTAMHNDKALERYERMDDAQKSAHQEIMEHKAFTLLNSTAITETQRKDFKARIEALGITPRNPRESSGGFKDAFKSRTRNQFASPY